MTILQIILAVLSLFQKGIELYANWRLRKDGANEVLVEAMKRREKAQEDVRTIHDKVDTNPEYRQSIIDKIKERAKVGKDQ